MESGRQDRTHCDRTLQGLKRIGELEEQQIGLCGEMLKAYGRSMYSMDMYAIGSLKRSLSLGAAIKVLIESWNLVSSRALLRLQLDTALRFYAAFLVENPHRFVEHVIDGKKVSGLKARDGKIMTDKYLVDRLSKKHKWIQRVYETTSGYVHLSERQMFDAVVLTSEDPSEREVTFVVSASDHHFPDFSFYEVAECFIESTEIFLHYLVGWIFTKDNPHVIADLRAKGYNSEDV